MGRLPPCDHDECGVTACTQPAVDTEAAAVWERLTERQRATVLWIAKDGPSIDYMTATLRSLRALGIKGDGCTLTDLGRRVAAHGRKGGV